MYDTDLNTYLGLDPTKVNLSHIVIKVSDQDKYLKDW